MRLLGTTRVFNGLWYRVSIVLLNQNGRTDALLYVDGETSLSTRRAGRSARRAARRGSTRRTR